MTAMIATEADRPARRPSPYRLSALGRDYGFVLPGFFLSLAAFGLLFPLGVTSVSLLVVWVGVVMVPATLWLARGFADLSRARLRWWGHPVARVEMVPRKPGLRGFISTVLEPRRWLDLIYEVFIGFPLHLITFVVTVTWTAGALGGITEWFWGRFIPQDDDDVYAWGAVLDLLSGGSVPEAWTHSMFLEYLLDFVIGLLLLVTLPLIMRLLALVDAAVMGAALGGTSGRGTRDAATVPDVGGETIAAPSSAAAAGGPAPAATDPGAVPARARARGVGQGTALPRTGQATSEVSSDGWSWIAAGTFSVTLICVSWPVSANVYDMHSALAMLLSFGTAAMMLLSVPAARTCWALAVSVGALTAAATALLGDRAEGLPDGLPWPWPVTGIIALAFVTGLTALRRPWPWAAAGWLVVQVPTALIGIFGGSDARGDLVITDLIVTASVSLATLLLGVGIRVLYLSRSALRQERLASAELAAEREELDERTRIARELHDVVAHSMSVISVQATTAPYRLQGMDEATASEFATIADSSRQALTEMRSLLKLLRSPAGGSTPDLAPQATLEQIPELIETTRASGASIEARLDELEDSMTAPATGLAAYRIVQEGLSNAVRHSPGAPIEVRVTVADASLEISVINGAPTLRQGSPAPGAGLGVAGVRERARAVGGHAEAEPTENGGFRLEATLPR